MPKAQVAHPAALRPMPPQDLADQLLDLTFRPAPELRAWAFSTFIDPGAPLRNQDHDHLRDADVAFLWASSGFVKQGRRVVGTAEDTQYLSQGSAWKKGRAEQQMCEWFERMPDFLITIDAFYWREAADADACALIEHELYHIAHKADEFGEPAYTRDGEPRLAIQGHDVEEFVGVVRRYGIGDPDSSLARLIIAAASGPTVQPLQVAHACGVCIKA